MTQTVNELLVAQGGLRVPAGAAAGSMAKSDSAGNISWETLSTLATALGLPANIMNFRGPWSGTNAYAVNDVVLYEGALLICQTAQSASPSPYGIGGNTGTNSATTVAAPASILAGDIIVAITWANGNVSAPAVPTMPSGPFTQQALASGSYGTLQISTKVAGGSDSGATITSALAGTTPSSTVIRVYRNAAIGSAVIGAGATAGGGATINAPTAVVTGAAVVVSGMGTYGDAFGNPQSWSASGLNQQIQDVYQAGLSVQDFAMSGAGTSPTTPQTDFPYGMNYLPFTLTLAPASAISPSAWSNLDQGLPQTQQSSTSYTFALTDAGTQVQSTNASATTFTIPTNAVTAFPVGSVLYAYQLGAGPLSVAPAAGVTLNIPTNGVLTLSQYQSMMLVKTATNTWTSICYGPANPLNWRGTYNTTFSYAVDDVVLYQGALYACGVANSASSIYYSYPNLTGTATASGNNGGGTVTVPSTTLVGDEITLALTTIGTTTLPTAPTGYTLSYSINATGGTYGCNLGVYTKIAVSGDIGATVTIPSLTNLWFAVMRTYTSNGLDTGAAAHATSSTANTGTISPVAVSSTLGALSRSVYFFAAFINNQAGDTPSFATSSNATNQAVYSNPTGSTYQVMGVEDCTVATIGASPIAGGAFTIASGASGSPTCAQVALTLQEMQTVGGWNASNWVNLGPGNTMNWRGVWVGANAYNIDDVVNYNGQLYICNTANAAPSLAGYRGATAGTQRSATLNVNLPTGTVAGDYLILTVVNDSGVPGGSAATLPAGWTSLLSLQSANDVGNSPANMIVGWKVATPADITTGHIVVPSQQNYYGANLVSAQLSGPPYSVQNQTPVKTTTGAAIAPVTTAVAPGDIPLFIWGSSYFSGSPPDNTLSGSGGLGFVGSGGGNPAVDTYHTATVTATGSAPVTATLTPGESSGLGIAQVTLAMPTQSFQAANWTPLPQAPSAISSTQQAGTTYTFALADAGTVVESTGASATTFTVPSNLSVPFAVGTVIYAYQYGAGVLSLAGAPGVTLLNNQSGISQYGMVQLRQRAANVWAVASFGDPTTMAPSTQNGATYTFALTDAGTFVQGNSASPQTFTIPTNATTALPVGSVIYVCQQGAGPLTITPAAGVTVNVPGNGSTTLAQYNTCILLQTAANVWTVVQTGVLSPKSVNTVAASGAAQTIPSPAAYAVNYITMTANCTLTFPTAAVGATFRLALKQDATGSRAVTWPANILWGSGSHSLSTSPSVTDYFEFTCLDGTFWVGSLLVGAAQASLVWLTGQTWTAAAGSSVTVVVPTTTKVGDLILIFTGQDNLTSGGTTPATPTGYAQVSGLVNIHAYNGGRGTSITVFSKTATSGDIGASVTVSLSSSNTVVACRSYTCGGIDAVNSAISTGNGPFAPPVINTTVNSEVITTFMVGMSGAGGISASSLGTGGTSTNFANNMGFGSAWEMAANEDFLIASSGGTSSGGALSQTGSTSMSWAGVSLSLLPTVV